MQRTSGDTKSSATLIQLQRFRTFSQNGRTEIVDAELRCGGELAHLVWGAGRDEDGVSHGLRDGPASHSVFL